MVWPTKQSITEAKSGEPAMLSLYASNVVEKYDESDVSELPKSSFPLVLFPSSRSLLGRTHHKSKFFIASASFQATTSHILNFASLVFVEKLVLCTKSKESFQSLVEAVHTIRDVPSPDKNDENTIS